MNRSNVWTLCDLGDAEALVGVVRTVPASANICGWSYGDGKRRGVVRGEGGQWSISDAAGAVPAPILHYAVVRGSMPCVQAALDNEADVDAVVHGSKADEIAEKCGFTDIAESIQTERRRRADVFGILQNSEQKKREAICSDENSRFARIESLLQNGMVTFDVQVHDAGPKSAFSMTVPRYISFPTFFSKIEEAVGFRVLLSFTVPIPKLPPLDPALEGSVSPSEERARWELEQRIARQPRHMELTQRTLSRFLSMNGASKCLARPLAFGYMGLKDAQKTAEDVKANRPPIVRVAEKINSVEREGGSRDEKIQKWKRILDEEEKGRSYFRTLTPQQYQEHIDRSYTFEVKKKRESREALDEYEKTQLQQLTKLKRCSLELSSEEADLVHRLYDEALESREAKRQTLEDEKTQSVPQLNVSILSAEELNESTLRLYQSGHSGSLPDLDRKIYGTPTESRRLSKGAFKQHVTRLYTDSLSNKKASIQKIRASYVFQPPKASKLSPDVLNESASRLSTKNPPKFKDDHSPSAGV